MNKFIFKNGGKSPAWTRKEGQSKSGGLNEKGRRSYEKENPGSDLKPPQPQGGARKRSFCARSEGQQKMHNIDCRKDPDKRICKAQRKWKCENGGKFSFKNGGRLFKTSANNTKLFKHGGIITGGVLHSEKNQLGDRGIPVVPVDSFQKGGQYDKNAKIAEVEKEELVLHKKSAEQIDKLVDEYNDCGCPGKLVELGKYIVSILPNIEDKACKINGYCQLKQVK